MRYTRALSVRNVNPPHGSTPLLSSPSLKTEPTVSQAFLSMKRQITCDLKSNRNDKSLAGQVDPRIAPLVSWLNEETESYVTSSSCSGRLLLFHRGDEMGATRHKKRGSCGLGKVVETHDPVENVKVAVASVYKPAIASFSSATVEPAKRTELLHLQFRPMILHVFASDFSAAARILECARESGQNSSGILSFSPSGSRNLSVSPPAKITCCITSSLYMDVPLRSSNRWILTGPPNKENAASSDAEWDSMLEYCVEHSNMLFEQNFSRMERFWREMRKRSVR